MRPLHREVMPPRSRDAYESTPIPWLAEILLLGVGGAIYTMFIIGLSYMMFRVLF